MDLSLLTPKGALVVVAVVLPAAALALAHARVDRARTLMGLPAPAARRRALVPAALGAVAALLALAAMQPVVRSSEERRVREDAEVLVVLDTSRSMLARAEPGGAPRIARAKRAAAEIRRELGDVRVGLASLTDRVLPHLFPTADDEVYAATLDDAVGIAEPPPQRASLEATWLGALAGVASQGFFTPAATRRAVVVLTDGESAAYSPGDVRDALTARRLTPVFVRLWSADERVFGPDGVPEPYRPDPTSAQPFDTLAGGAVYAEGEAGDAAAAVRRALGSGPSAIAGTQPRTLALAPYAAAAALLPLALVVWRRNVR